jgi:redox-sensitive bicupin YhaK (pirin superfamily)
MTAGTGVSHSEFNPSKTDPTHFLQIWIVPELKGLKPDYEQREFPKSERRGKLRLVASRYGTEGSVTIHQDVKLYNALLKAGEEVLHELALSHHGWVQVVKGEVDLNGTTLKASDGAAISDETLLKIRASKDAEILLFDLK